MGVSDTTEEDWEKHYAEENHLEMADKYRPPFLPYSYSNDDLYNVYQQGKADAIKERESEKDITNEYYHEKYNTITCPHCGCTLNRFVCMSHHYCYVCGGKFGKINIKEEE